LNPSLKARLGEGTEREPQGLESYPTPYNFWHVQKHQKPLQLRSPGDPSLQFVRKISGFNKPSKANEASFNTAIEEVAAVCARLLHSLETTAPPKSREEEAAKAKARSAERFGLA
jgi:hypothetical protein